MEYFSPGKGRPMGNCFEILLSKSKKLGAANLFPWCEIYVLDFIFTRFFLHIVEKISIIMIFIAQIPYNFFQVNLTFQIPHKDLRIIGITNFEILSFTNKLLKKIVIHRILNINSGSAKTYFTLVQKRASNQSFDSLTQCSNIRKIVQWKQQVF